MEHEQYLDYLRVSTWDFTAYTHTLSTFRTYSARWRKSKWLQYAGFKSDEYFYGQGEQTGRRHFVLQASGPASRRLFDLVKKNDVFYCTRIDLQATIKEPENYDPTKLYNDVRTMSGNKRNSSLILSSTGSTVYFGNRTSNSFARCYQKNIDERKFLRLELELKGQTSKWIYENLRLGKITIDDAYNQLFKRFKKPEYLDTWFSIHKPENAEYERFDYLKNKNDKLSWLMSLENVILQMGNDHVTGQMVKTFLENILEKIENGTT